MRVILNDFVTNTDFIRVSYMINEMKKLGTNQCVFSYSDCVYSCRINKNKTMVFHRWVP